MARSYGPRVANFRLTISDSAYLPAVMIDAPRYSRRRCLAMMSGGLIGLTCAVAARADEDPRVAPEQFHRYGVDQQSITLATRTGDYPILVALVFNPDDARSALIARRRIEPDEGILYVNDYDRLLGISNQGVRFPTDLLFVADDGRVIAVHPAIMANDDRVITSSIPVKAALQVIAGTIARAASAPGDHLISPLFGRSL